MSRCMKKRQFDCAQIWLRAARAVCQVRLRSSLRAWGSLVLSFPLHRLLPDCMDPKTGLNLHCMQIQICFVIFLTGTESRICLLIMSFTCFFLSGQSLMSCRPFLATSNKINGYRSHDNNLIRATQCAASEPTWIAFALTIFRNCAVISETPSNFEMIFKIKSLRITSRGCPCMASYIIKHAYFDRSLNRDPLWSSSKIVGM